MEQSQNKILFRPIKDKTAINILESEVKTSKSLFFKSKY